MKKIALAGEAIAKKVLAYLVVSVCVVVGVIALCFVVGSIFSSFGDSSKPAKDAPPSSASAEHGDQKLDFSRPVYTKDYAAICPSSLLFDKRADHDGEAVVDAINSLFSRSDKLNKLGCEEWEGGIKVEASPMDDSDGSSPLVSLRVDGEMDGSAFTLQSQLENHPRDPKLSATEEAPSNPSSQQPTAAEKPAQIVTQNPPSNSPASDPNSPSAAPYPTAASAANQPSAMPPAIADEVKEAIKDSPDVREKAMESGAIMIFMPYGPCGILYRRSTDFLWHQDPGTDQAYPDFGSAMAAAESQCETLFHDQKLARGAHGN